MWGVLIFAPIIGILGFIVSSAIAYNIFFYQFYDYLYEVKDNDGKVAKRIRKIIEIVYYIVVYFMFSLIIGLVLRIWDAFF
ncbi:hypothetical protein ZA02_05970 [Campylobacter lanienae]|uniref:hypothetical protein n=1 Tax=Campylobacter lanienae TaxID=75658 RepID=UPI0011AD29E4|nr:hypothetical protein [Campylobacter lanienae]TWO13998.1 hypothetical protein ZA02_05970 [Campylobacter lanienae]